MNTMNTMRVTFFVCFEWVPCELTLKVMDPPLFWYWNSECQMSGPRWEEDPLPPPPPFSVKRIGKAEQSTCIIEGANE